MLFRSQYKSLSKKLQYGAAAVAAKAFGALFPRQGNSFAMICMKPDAGQGLWPWIEPGQKGPTISRTYVRERYRLNKRSGWAGASPSLQMHPAILFAQCFAI